MKKIIFILLTLAFFINVTKAKALDEENDWQEEQLYGDNVETEYRYRFYREYDYGDYVMLGQASEYQHEDKENIIYGDYSEYMDTCIEQEGYEIEKNIEYQYQELLPIQYVKITNTSDEVIKLKKIEINNFDTIVNYEFYIGIDGNKKDLTIKPKGYIIFWMSYSVPLRQFTFQLELENEFASYDITFSNNRYFNDDKLVAKVSGDTNRLVYKYDNTFSLYENYTPVYTSYNINIDNFTKVISNKEVCRKREIKTYRYNIGKEYYDDNYYVSSDDLIYLEKEERLEFKKDENDYKIFYRYKKNNDKQLNDKTDNVLEEIKKDNEDSNNNQLVDNKGENNEKNKEEEKLESDKVLVNNDISKEENTKETNNLTDELNKEENIKLVKTGIDNSLNYNYLILYVLTLLLIALFLIKKIKKMSNENNN